MKFTYFVLVVSMVLFSACTKKSADSAKAEAATLPYDSAVSFVHHKIEDKANAAEVSGEPVSWSQLHSQAPALQDLDNRWRNKIIQFSYLLGDTFLKEGKAVEGKVNIDFYFDAPEKYPEPAENIVTNFAGRGEVDILAKVGEKTITKKEFIAAHLSHAKLYENLYTQRMQRLNGIVVRRFILKAAKEAGVGMEDYVRKNIIPNPAEVTNDMVFAYAKEKGIGESDLNENMVERLKDIVRQRQRDSKIEDYVAKNLIKETIKVGFTGPEIKLNEPQFDDSVPQWGSAQGPSIVYVGHWSCENCKNPLEMFLGEKQKWNKQANGHFVYFFPERDREARMSAEAGMCLYNQSPDYLWSFMKSAPDNTEEAIDTAAKESGANFEEFRKCFLAREFQDAVSSHLAIAKNMGVVKGPLLVVEGRVFEAPFKSAEVNRFIASVMPEGQKSSGGFFSRIASWFSNLF